MTSNHRAGDDTRHRRSGDNLNPFVAYRERLDSYGVATEGGLSDDHFVDIVGHLDTAIARIEGHGFVETPVVLADDLARAIGHRGELWVKDETANVGGSHKARHLFGVALHLLVGEALGAARSDQLAIASCGNAALGAAVVARALDRELHVFVPLWADETVISSLEALGATIDRCRRTDGEAGDPCHHRFLEATAMGATAFGVQGTDTPTTFDGGRTLGWELADQVAAIDTLYIQVGGGALATAVSMAIPDARLNPVQAQGCAPLRRAWDRLAPDFDFAMARTHPDRYMWPWDDEPTSIATGILDDVTYDWLALLDRTRASDGEPIVAPEQTVTRAWDLARAHTDIPVSPTGSAGLAGLITDPPPTTGRTALLFTGLDRSSR